MTNQSFKSWLAGLDRLAAEQWSPLEQAMQERSEGAVAVAAIEVQIDAERCYWLCHAGSVVRRGTTRGLRRYSCKRCGVALTTAFRWRHRFLHQARQLAGQLEGLVEADATYVSHSRKGERKPQWKARRRGGRARKRRLSREQVPVLLVTARGGATAGQHEAVNVSAGKRVSKSYHIQTVNSQHQQWNAFLGPFRAAATKCLDSYLRWFQQVGLVRKASPRSCLVASMTPKCMRFANRAKDSRGSGGVACLRSPTTPKARIMYYLLCSKTARQDHALIGRRSDEHRRIAQRVQTGSSTSHRGSVENRAVIGLK